LTEHNAIVYYIDTIKQYVIDCKWSLQRGDKTMKTIRRGMNINEVLNERTDLVLDTIERLDEDVYTTYIGIAFANDYNTKMYVDVINDIVEEVGLCALV